MTRVIPRNLPMRSMMSSVIPGLGERREHDYYCSVPKGHELQKLRVKDVCSVLVKLCECREQRRC